MLSRDQRKGIQTNFTAISGCEKQLEAVRFHLSRMVDNFSTVNLTKNDDLQQYPTNRLSLPKTENQDMFNCFESQMHSNKQIRKGSSFVNNTEQKNDISPSTIKSPIYQNKDMKSNNQLQRSTRSGSQSKFSSQERNQKSQPHQQKQQKFYSQALEGNNQSHISTPSQYNSQKYYPLDCGGTQTQKLPNSNNSSKYQPQNTEGNKKIYRSPNQVDQRKNYPQNNVFSSNAISRQIGHQTHSQNTKSNYQIQRSPNQKIYKQNCSVLNSNDLISQKINAYPAEVNHQEAFVLSKPDDTYINKNLLLNNSNTLLCPQKKYISPQRADIFYDLSFKNNLVVTPEQVRRSHNNSQLDTQATYNSKKHLGYTPERSTEQVLANEYSSYVQLRKSNNNDITASKSLKSGISNIPLDPSDIVVNQDELNSHKSTYTLFRLLLKEILLLRQVEDLKCQISLRQDFNLLDAFRLFDIQGLGKSNAQNLLGGFIDLEIEATEIQVFLILKQYSRKCENTLCYSDFTKMLLPSTIDYQIMLQNRAPTFIQSTKVHDLFSEITTQYLRGLLELIITTEETIIKYKAHINVKSDILFHQLDKQDKGYLDESDFLNMFAAYEVHPTHVDLQRVIQRFQLNQVHKSGEVQITLEMFKNQID